MPDWSSMGAALRGSSVGQERPRCGWQLGGDDLSKSSFKIEIDATSLWSDDGGLTGHLKNRDFFDVSQYPKVEFETTRIELPSTKEAVVTGKLTMLGKAVEVTIPCKIEATDGGLRVKSDFTIDRTQWGMTYGRGKDEVEIAARFVFGR